ncbi:unnamed protein product [Moneuplotes crassus]|uniref:Exportin-T n=2 Tax=Euplotes crassus TaxID=5936 RepID=A0AAD1XNI8_EUPCR|nr:unnamed protein product [Moneuplotes crassus]
MSAASPFKDISVPEVEASYENIVEALNSTSKESIAMIHAWERNSVKYYEQLTEMVSNCEGDLQLQSIICMKNSLARSIKNATANPKKRPIVLTNNDLKEKLKKYLISLIPLAPKSLPFNIFSQTLDIICVFVRLDYPVKWPALTDHIFNSLDSICENLSSINEDNIEELYRFLMLYLQVLKQQSEKKIPMKKAPFIKQAKTHLQKLFLLWKNISLGRYSSMTSEEFSKNDEAIFEISKLMDKCAIYIMICGFTINDLGVEEGNVYIEVIQALVEKLVFLKETTADLFCKSTAIQNGSEDKLLECFYKVLKSLIFNLSGFQYSEPLMFYTSLKPYLETCITILAKNTCFNDKCQKVALLAIKNVVNTVIYNHVEAEEPNNQDGSSNMNYSNIPAKYKNFQEEFNTVVRIYQDIFTQENIVNLLNLLAGKYLKLDSLNLWEDDKENFIEIEDELQYGRDTKVDKESNYNFIAYVLCDKIFTFFTEHSQAWLGEQIQFILENQTPNQILLDYCNDKLGEASEEEYQGLLPQLIEDALLSLAGILPNIYDYKGAQFTDYLDIGVILNYLETRIGDTSSKILKRRYCLLLSLWAGRMSAESLIDYLAKSCTILFSHESTDLVVKFIAMTTFRDILRIVEEQRKTHKHNSVYSEESLHRIIRKYNSDLYRRPECVRISNADMEGIVNLITLLIEGCKENSGEGVLENFKNIDFMRIVSLDSPLIKEALYDMCKNLISISHDSLSIFEINFKLLEHNIQVSIDYDLFFHWLYLLRISDLEHNPNAGQICQQFINTYAEPLLQSNSSPKFSVLTSDIIHEHILSNLIPLSGDSLTIQSCLEFLLEQWQHWNKVEISQGDCSDSNLMERKEHLVKVLITIFMKYIEDPMSESKDVLLPILEKAFMIGVDEIASDNFDPSMQHLSSYITQLLIFVNRGIVIFEDIRKNIFESQDQKQSMLFLEKWFEKMNFLMLNFARRINQLAIIHALPLLDKEMITLVFPKMAPLVFNAVGSDVYIKETAKSEDFYSPEKIEGYEVVSMVKHVNGKTSKRLATLRQNDPLMKISLAESFINNLQTMCMKYQVDEKDLGGLLDDENQKKKFHDLVKSTARYFKE